MAGGKSTQPLFELLAKGQSDALTRQAKQFIPGGPETKADEAVPKDANREVVTPARGSASGEPTRGAHAPAPAGGAAGVGGAMAGASAGVSGGASAAMPRRRDTGGVTVPVAVVYVGSAVLLGLLVLVWSIAYNRGRSAENADWQRSLSGGAIGADPLVDPTGGAGAQPRTAEPRAGGESRPARSNQDTNAGSLLGGGRPGILTSGGVLSADPRQPGRNYLKLATLGRADAERSISFLAASGVETIGVPVVDPKTGSANNPARYEVFATVGITGEEYSNNRPVRAELEAKVAKIGERFRREAKGPTDFSKPLWMKHNP
jgi:hypothetical protein